MNILNQLGTYLTDTAHWSGETGIPLRVLEHLEYTGLALLIAVVIALPVGLMIGHTNKGAFWVIALGNASRSLPTLGLLTLAVLLAGLGLIPALVALVILAVPPILTSTYAGIRNVEPSITDAARGVGMKELQVLLRAELPSAAPLIISGIRSATLQVVATATVAAYVALGGLGRLLVDGLASLDYAQMLAGAVLVAALALVVDGVLALVQRLLVSDGLTGRASRAGTVSDTTEPFPAALPSPAPERTALS